MSVPIRVHFAGRWAAYVSGYDARSLLTALAGRTPRWSAVAGGWATTPATARDVIAAAEREGRTVLATDENQPELGGERAMTRCPCCHSSLRVRGGRTDVRHLTWCRWASRPERKKLT